MKMIGIVFLLAASLVAGWILAIEYRWRQTNGDGVSYHTSLTIEQVQALSSLVTSRVDVADVQETRLAGYFGGMKVALLVKGDFLLGIDLSRAKFKSVDSTTRKAVLVLPQPQITSPRLDQNRTRLYAISESGLWLIAPGGDPTLEALIDRAYRDAQHLIAHAGDDPSLMLRARRQAERVLMAFVEDIGWTLEVRWAE